MYITFTYLDYNIAYLYSFLFLGYN